MTTEFAIEIGEEYVDFPKRGSSGSGRPREANRFDTLVQESYDNGTTFEDGRTIGAGVRVYVSPPTHEAIKLVRQQAHAAANFLGLGLDVFIDEEGVILRARDKRATRTYEDGRKRRRKGSEGE